MAETKIPVVVVLDSIRSALNVGSIFRTSDAFCIQEIMLCGFTATPPHKEINKTAIGATESVKWSFIDNITEAVHQLKSNGFSLIGIEQTDKSIPLHEFKIDSKSKYALFLGNEVDGLSEELMPFLDFSIEIPQYGTKHSLNVAVCAGIVLYEFGKAMHL